MKTIKERLASRSAPDAFGCILWRGRIDPKGYGRIRIGGRAGQLRTAHRVAWEVENGPIPAGMNVCHKCDVRNCINPGHLFLGTQADNIADMVKKKRDRHPRGSVHGRAKLTEADIYAIRASAGVQQDIADLYGVEQATISSIKRRKIWRHLP